MTSLTIFLAYFLVGIILLSIACKHDEVQSLLERLTPAQVTLAFILAGLFWFPIFILTLFYSSEDIEDMVNKRK